MTHKNLPHILAPRKRKFLSTKIENSWRFQINKFDLIEASYDVEDKHHEIERRVYSVPEAVASFASYLVSLRRQEGLHAIIDMGAGTTDISICNLKDPYDQSMSYWYAARNIPYGTIGIERLIAEQLMKDKSACTCQDIFDCLKNISHNSGEIQQKIQKELKRFKESRGYCSAWGEAFHYHLKGTSLWERVEIFLIGGGANLSAAKYVFSEPWTRLRKENSGEFI